MIMQVIMDLIMMPKDRQTYLGWFPIELPEDTFYKHKCTIVRLAKGWGRYVYHGAEIQTMQNREGMKNRYGLVSFWRALCEECS